MDIGSDSATETMQIAEPNGYIEEEGEEAQNQEGVQVADGHGITHLIFVQISPVNDCPRDQPR